MPKTVVLGVTGSIAAYKAADIVSKLRKNGVEVRVIMTAAAAEFITPLTLETMSANPVVTDMFNRETPWEVEHISLAKKADAFVVAPASADFISKAAAGIADDMLTTTLLATSAPVIVAPAMNVAMLENPVIKSNIGLLRDRGFFFVEPEEGLLACGDVGKGRLAPVDDIVALIMEVLYPRRDLEGMRILVSAGPTVEAIDPVRYITNRSSGRMGYAIAAAAYERGAEVVLVSGPVNIAPPAGVRVVGVTSSRDMYEAVNAEFEGCDGLIMAAAPADFTPAEYSDTKIKKSSGDMEELKLVHTADILASLRDKKGSRRVMGFAAETNDLEKHAADKLQRKNLDMIAANDVTAPGAGFAVGTNAVTLFSRGGAVEKSGLMTKEALAHWLLDRLFQN